VAASYRTLWISDVHLGHSASHATDLLNFLEEVRAERIYLVGDIVDLARLKSRPCFPEAHLAVIAELVHLARRGTEVIYVPGNHDYEFRGMAGRDICGIPVVLEATHETALGRKLLVMHGDVLDGQIRNGTGLERFGAAAYVMLMEANTIINRIRRSIGQDYFPMMAGIKRRLRGANAYIERFEEVATEHARQRGFDGVVCGHIHRPAIRMIDGCLYLNDGDWVEHRTALAESGDGIMQILNWEKDGVRVDAADGVSALAA
jgi:UDP-2,3-diacylglucosamine pyrophosphatase LpxH